MDTARRTRPFALTPLVAALLTTLVAAQEPSARPSQPAFRTSADLVIVDAVVLGRDGRPVTNLTAEDFELLDEGKPQRIELFQVVSTASTTELTNGARRRLPYSTNTGVDARPTRAFALFFDDLHLTQAEGERAKEAIRPFIERELRDGDLVSLVVPGRALRWHARMPQGRGELLQIVSGLQGAYLPDGSTEQMSDYEAYRIHVFQDEAVVNQVERRWQNLRVLGRSPTDLSRDPGFRPENRGGNIGIVPQDIAIRAAAVYGQAAARNRATLEALERSLEGLTPVRGRKSVILLSPGFIEDQERREPRLVLDAARRANAAIYFVDARGLLVGTPFAQAQSVGPLDGRDVGAAHADITLGAEGAETLSNGSGGFSIRNRNDLAGALARIGMESQVYYLLGFAPTTSHKAGSFRRIQVRVQRPDVDVRARRGYFAGGVIRTGTDALASGPADDLARATESPYELDAIPLRASAFVFGEADPGKAVVLLALEADLRAFDLRPEGGRLVDVLELRLVVTRQETGAGERHEREVEMSFPATARFDGAAWHGLTQELGLLPGRYQARVAVRDRNSGRIGAVTHDFEVPPLDGLRLTTPILTDTIESPAFGSQAPPKPVLVVRRSFPAGTTLYYQFAVHGAARDDAGGARVTGSHRLLRADGSLVRQMPPRHIAAGPEGGISRLSGLNLSGVTEGEYELVLSVTDEVAGRTVERREAFTILPPERHAP